MKRTFVSIFTGTSLLFLLAMAAIWIRGNRSTDVLMIPVGSQKRLLISSHAEHWVEMTHLDHWAGERFGWWSGYGWRNVGPMLFWQWAHTSASLQMWIIQGQLVSPRTHPRGPCATEGSYDRAVALGYPNPIPVGSPDWAAMNGWEVKVPTGRLFITGVLIPLVTATWWVVRIRRQLRRRRRLRFGLCVSCGYDVRGNSGRCSECGTPVETIARIHAPQ
jgi:hypothetical protein